MYKLAKVPEQKWKPTCKERQRYVKDLTGTYLHWGISIVFFQKISRDIHYEIPNDSSTLLYTQNILLYHTSYFFMLLGCLKFDRISCFITNFLQCVNVIQLRYTIHPQEAAGGLASAQTNAKSFKMCYQSRLVLYHIRPTAPGLHFC